MYETECFISAGGKVDTFHKYKKWLNQKQKEGKIEIIAVTGLDTLLVVTYRKAVA